MLFLLFSIGTSLLVQQSEERSFLQWMRSTNNIFTGSEYHLRLGIYLSNMRFVQEQNTAYSKGLSTYKASLNRFAAMTPSEYNTLLGYRAPSNYAGQKRPAIRERHNRQAAETVDWRDKNVVTPIKDQITCGGCWAFCTTQAFESAHAIKHGELLRFSEQNLIDCVLDCWGCQGGWLEPAYQYIIDYQNRQINLESEYIFVGYEQGCYFEKYAKAGSLDHYEALETTEEAMAEDVETRGPLCVALDAATAGFMNYHSGIFSSSVCNPGYINHAVGLIGYGTENGTKYWLLKNSWGTAWGIQGYMKFIRGINNCGIASQPGIPVVN